MRAASGDSAGRAVVRVRDVSFSYDDHPALRDITFDIIQGDFLAIIGPNGSGKSTLLRLILGLLGPFDGEITLFGTPIRSFHEWARIGYVPQKATHVDPIFPISVEEVVGLGRTGVKRPPAWLSGADRKAVRSALERVHMEAFSDRRLGDLSGGQQQKVFIARAIVNEPMVLFLDEPTTGIDAGAQDDFYGLLDRLNRQGITVVLITHDIGVVTKHVNKVACLNQKLVFHGTHEEFCASAEARSIIPGEDHLILHRH